MEWIITISPFYAGFSRQQRQTLAMQRRFGLKFSLRPAICRPYSVDFAGD
jgi:hypothetical protein